MAKGKEKFPKRILVTHHVDGKTEYLITHDDIDDLSNEVQDGDQIAIYERAGVRKLKVTKTLE